MELRGCESFSPGLALPTFFNIIIIIIILIIIIEAMRDFGSVFQFLSPGSQ